MEQLKIGLEWYMNPDHLPFMIGIEKGWFKKANLDITLLEPEKHIDAMEEVKKGTMDIAITEPLHLVEDRASDEPIIGFSRFFHTNGGVMYRKDKGIKRPSDLIGKRIQYPRAPGLGGVAIVKTMVEADGGQCTYDNFERVNHSFYHTDALEKDLADAATLIFQNVEIVEALHNGLDVDFFALKDWGVPDFCQLIFTTSPSILKEREDAIHRFIKVVRKSIDYLALHKEEAKEIYFSFTKEDPADELTNKILDVTIPFFTNDFSMADDYYNLLQQWLKQTGKIEKTIDAKSYWTNQIAF